MTYLNRLVAGLNQRFGLQLGVDQWWLVGAAFILTWDGRLEWQAAPGIIHGVPNPYAALELYVFDLWMLAGMGLAAWQGRWGWRRLISGRVSRWLALAALAVGLGVGLSTAGAYFPSVAIYQAMRWSWTGILVAFVLTRDWNAPYLRAVLLAFLAGMLGQAVLVLGQAVFQHSLLEGRVAHLVGESGFNAYTRGISFVRFGEWRWVRPYGSFEHPNLLAMYTLVSLVVLLFFRQVVAGLPARLGLSRREWWVGVGLAGVVLMLTLSRAAWVAGGLIALGWGNLAWASNWRQLSRRWLVVGAALGGVAMGLMVWRVVSLWGVNQISFNGRLELNHVAVELMQDQPWGIGWGHWRWWLPAYDPHGMFEYVREPVHNVYLLIGAELGVGTLLLVSAFSLWLWWRLYFFTTPPSVLRRLMQAVWPGVLCLMWVDHYWWTLQGGRLMLALVVGLSLLAIERPRESVVK